MSLHHRVDRLLNENANLKRENERLLGVGVSKCVATQTKEEEEKKDDKGENGGVQ